MSLPSTDIVISPYTVADIATANGFKTDASGTRILYQSIFNLDDIKNVLSTARGKITRDDVVSLVSNFVASSNSARALGERPFRAAVAFAFLRNSSLAPFASIYNPELQSRLGGIMNIQAGDFDAFERKVFLGKFTSVKYPSRAPSGEAFQASLGLLGQHVSAAYNGLPNRGDYFFFRYVDVVYREALIEAVQQALAPAPASSSASSLSISVDEGDDEDFDTKTVAYPSATTTNTALVNSADLANQRRVASDLRRALGDRDAQVAQLQNQLVIFKQQLDVSAAEAEQRQLAEQAVRQADAKIDNLNRQIQLYQARSGDFQRGVVAIGEQKSLLDLLSQAGDLKFLGFQDRGSLPRAMSLLVSNARKDQQLLIQANDNVQKAEDRSKALVLASQQSDQQRRQSEDELNEAIRKANQERDQVRRDLTRAETRLLEANLAVKEIETKLAIAGADASSAEAKTKNALDGQTEAKRLFSDLQKVNDTLNAKLVELKTTTNTSSAALDNAKIALTESRKREDDLKAQILKLEGDIKTLRFEGEKTNDTLNALRHDVKLLVEADVRGVDGPDSKDLVFVGENDVAFIRYAFGKLRKQVAVAKQEYQDLESKSRQDRTTADDTLSKSRIKADASNSEVERFKTENKDLQRQLEELKGLPVASVVISSLAPVDAPAPVALADAISFATGPRTLLLEAPKQENPTVKSAISVLSDIRPVGDDTKDIAIKMENTADITEMCRDQVMTLAIIDMLVNTFGNAYNPLPTLASQLQAFLYGKVKAAALFVNELIIVHNALKKRIDRTKKLRDVLANNFAYEAKQKFTYQILILQTIRQTKDKYNSAIQSRTTAQDSTFFWWITDLQATTELRKALGSSPHSYDSALRRIMVRDSSANYQLVQAILANEGVLMNLFRLMCGVLWSSTSITANVRTLLNLNGGAVLVYQLIQMAAALNPSLFSGDATLTIMYNNLNGVYKGPKITARIGAGQQEISVGGSVTDTIKALGYVGLIEEQAKQLEQPR